MANVFCRVCGLERVANKKPCWGCGELNESWRAALLRHLPLIAAISRSTRRFLRAAA
jgi:hypothetical protein